MDRDTLARVANELRRSTMNDRFTFYIASHDLNDELRASYRSLSRTRSEAVHGNPVDVNFEKSSKMRDLLVVLLKTELKIQQELIWETLPHVYTLGVDFEWQFHD